MAAPSPGKQAWTPQQDKLFERALALYDDSSPSRWEQVASMVPGKDASQVRKHYELLVEDVNCIEAGRISLPRYNSVSFRDGYGEQAAMGGDVFAVKRASGLYPGQVPSSFGKGSAKAADQERKKGIPWTEEEHKLFLLGLEKFGKGDWRSISRNFVVSRTPTQVASHAQKYFIRLNSINKDKRRSSIHDITSIRNNQQASASVSSSPPPPTSSSSSSMAAEAAPPCSLSRPPLYIPPAVVEQPMSSPLPSPIAPQPILLPSSPLHLVRPALPASPLPISPSPHPRPTHMAFSLPQTAMHQ